MTRIAVIADPHVHDCDWSPRDSGLGRAIRTWADTAASTRVFNESLPAFHAALQRAVDEGARLALLVGDLTDDGQAPNIRAALHVIAAFRDRYGLRVLATPGNHDLFALAGRAQDKNFIGISGESVPLRSDTCPEAATLGTQDALEKMHVLGYWPDPADLHWETPFGQDPDWAARSYEARSPDGSARCQMIDASYLVEPEPGLWILSLDANVCIPRDGARDFSQACSFHDATDGGWAAVIDQRPYLLGWMADVAARARAAGKHLVAFSHYPPADVLGGTGAEEIALFGATGLARRIPPEDISLAFTATGVRLHFSGHLHVNDTARHGTGAEGFFNIAVPSPVGFAPAMKMLELADNRARIRTLSLCDIPGHDRAYSAYLSEAGWLGQPAPFAAHAPDHGAFLDRHLTGLVRDRYMAREWPAEMADFASRARMADLVGILGIEVETPDLPLRHLAEDWYRLRKAGVLAEPFVAAERLAFYRLLCAEIPDLTGDSLASRFAALLRILEGYLHRLPNGDFSIDLKALTIS